MRNILRIYSTERYINYVPKHEMVMMTEFTKAIINYLYMKERYVGFEHIDYPENDRVTLLGILEDVCAESLTVERHEAFLHVGFGLLNVYREFIRETFNNSQIIPIIKTLDSPRSNSVIIVTRE